MSTKPNDITREVLLDRVKSALDRLGLEEFPTAEDIVGTRALDDLIGIVHKAIQYERNRAATVAMRLGHRVTAAQIKKG